MTSREAAGKTAERLALLKRCVTFFLSLSVRLSFLFAFFIHHPRT